MCERSGSYILGALPRQEVACLTERKASRPVRAGRLFMLHETSVLLGWFISNLQVACDLEDARNAVRTKTGNLLVSLIDDNADQGHVPI